MSGRVRPPRWLVESDGSYRRPWTYVSTLVALCNPFWFWSRLDMRMRHRPVRILGWCVGFFLLGIAMSAYVYSVDMVQNIGAMGNQFSIWSVLRLFPEWHIKGLMYELSVRHTVVQFGVFLIWIAFVPTPLLAMRATTKARHFKWAHVRRGWLYSFWSFQLCVALLTFQGTLSQLGGRVPNSALMKSLYRFAVSHPLSVWMLYPLTIWIVVYWYTFFSRYLRLRYPVYVTLATLVISFMLAWIVYDLTIAPFVSPVTPNISWWRWEGLRW